MEYDSDEEAEMVTMGSRTIAIADSVEDIRRRLQQLNSLRKSRHFCDVVLQVGATEIHAHKAVLACASPYFFELFTRDDDRRRNTKEDKAVFKLGGNFQFEALDKLVQFAYTGEIDLSADIAKQVYLAANKLKMERVIKSCGEFLVSQLTPENCLSTRNIPGIASDSDLVEQIDRYISEQEDVMRISKEVTGISRLQLRVIQTSSDEVSVTSYALCMLAIEWIKRQMEEEDLTLEDLQEKKHLLYLNLDNSLHDCCEIKNGDAQDTEMVQDYKKISRKLSKTSIKATKKLPINLQPTKPRMMLYSRSISDEEDQLDLEWKLIVHSKVAERSYVAVATLNGAVSVLSVMQIVNPPSPSGYGGPMVQSRPASMEKVDNYTLIAHMTSSKCATGTGNVRGNLLVVGGYDRGECLKEVEVYSAKGNIWSSLPNLQTARGRFDLTVVNGLAYAVGGCDGNRELDTVEVLDMTTQQWTNVAPLPLARSNAGVCSHEGKVYCIGGWNGSFGIKQCDVYDPKKDTWSTISSLNIGRYQCGVDVLDNEIYVVGGCESWSCLGSMEILDVANNVWRNGPSLITPRRGCGLAVFKGKLVVMGGSDGTQSLCSTEIFDPLTHSWSPGPSMTSCRTNVSCTVMDGKLYAVGGFTGKCFVNTIEYLDPDTMEWTTFTPKPEGYKSKRQARSRATSTEELTAAGELELDAPIPEDSEFSKLNTTPNGFMFDMQGVC